MRELPPNWGEEIVVITYGAVAVAGVVALIIRCFF